MSAAPFTLSVPRRRVRISLTPLIDVVFILLLFFMLTSSFGQRGAVELATPKIATETTASSDAVLVELTAGGLRVSGRRVAPSRLPLVVAPLVGSGQPVAVRVEAGVPLSRLVVVLDDLRAVGASDVSVSKAR